MSDEQELGATTDTPLPVDDPRPPTEEQPFEQFREFCLEHDEWIRWHAD